MESTEESSKLAQCSSNISQNLNQKFHKLPEFNRFNKFLNPDLESLSLSL